MTFAIAVPGDQSPLNATGSLWALLLAALVFERAEGVGRHTVVAAFLIVARAG